MTIDKYLIREIVRDYSHNKEYSGKLANRYTYYEDAATRGMEKISKYRTNGVEHELFYRDFGSSDGGKLCVIIRDIKNIGRCGIYFSCQKIGKNITNKAYTLQTILTNKGQFWNNSRLEYDGINIENVRIEEIFYEEYGFVKKGSYSPTFIKKVNYKYDVDKSEKL